MRKRQSFGSAMYWIKGRRITLNRYLNEFYPPYDWRIIKNFFYENPIQAKVILEDYQKSNEAKLQAVAKMFIAGKSKIVYIIGARGSGKSATAFMLCSKVHDEIGRGVYYVSDSVNKSALPKWIRVIDNINEAPNGALAVIDEAAIQYNAREFMKKGHIDLTKMLAIARHKDIFLIFITQHTGLADKNIKRLRDMMIWKQSNDYSMAEQGSGNSKEHKFWQKVRSMMSPRSKAECLFEFPAHKRFINFSHELPSFWNDALSKVWGNKGFGGESKNEENKAIESPIKKKKEVIYI